MNSSLKPPKPQPPLFTDGGMDTGPVAAADPTQPEDRFAAFFDLMVLVEELCPVWPRREPFRDGGIWLL